jgi:hypothetical protein
VRPDSGIVCFARHAFISSQAKFDSSNPCASKQTYMKRGEMRLQIARALPVNVARFQKAGVGYDP